ncbi:MAG: hypothetical protein O7G85_00180, partial [Planctomycetota bacterium]|nr:hypothetical protein [Planctomycetota bacterium]
MDEHQPPEQEPTHNSDLTPSKEASDIQLPIEDESGAVENLPIEATLDEVEQVLDDIPSDMPDVTGIDPGKSSDDASDENLDESHDVSNDETTDDTYILETLESNRDAR